MVYSRTFFPTLCLIAGAAAAQTPAPAPPAAWDFDAPAPPAAPAPSSRPVRAPRPAPTPPLPPAAFAPQVATPTPSPTPSAVPAPPAPPAPPRPFYSDDHDFHFDFNFDFDAQQLNDEIKWKVDEARFKIKELDLENLNAQIKTMTKDYAKDYAQKFSSDIAGKFAYMPQIAARGRSQNDDRLYESGKQALDNHRWDEAVESFSVVASRGGPRADGALYWKAYGLNKLGKRTEAQAAIAELRKSHPSSKWLDDVKVLELEIQQSSGNPVPPDQVEDDLKVLALNSIMQSDPDRAVPLVADLLKSGQSLKIRKQAVYVLAQSPNPKAQQVVEQVVRGTSANPDLQIIAIRYYGERRKANGGEVLAEVYTASGDTYVKRAVISAFRSYRDRERLLNIAKTEKTPELRFEAINALKDLGGSQVDLWQLYQVEGTPEGKLQILEMIPSAGNTERIVEIAKSEKEPKVRRQAIQKLGNERNAAAGTALVSIYSAEQDQEMKRAIIDALSNQKNVKSLVDAAKAEKDPRMQQRIVERLAGMRSPEATEYLMEILNKK